MQVRRPKIYSQFHCINSKCQDTCCASWEIEVDEEAADYYRQVKGEFGDKLRSRMGTEGEETYFVLGEGRRCPFLTENNLCQIYQQLGEEALCDICREHPRFYQWFGDYTEMGLGLCCEEAARLVFSQTQPLKFELLTQEEEGEEAGEAAAEAREAEAAEAAAEAKEAEAAEEAGQDPILQALLEARDIAFGLVQNRRIPLEDRLCCLISFVEKVQEQLEREDAEGIRKLAEQWRSELESGLESKAPVGKQQWVRSSKTPTETLQHGMESQTGLEALQHVLTIYEKLESLDGSWPRKLEDLRAHLPELLDSFRGFREAYPNWERDYEHLMVYYLYRYFLEAVYDGNLLSPVRFSLLSLVLVALLDLDRWRQQGAFTLWDRIQTVKQYSKEIEYCPENMEELSRRCLEDPSFGHPEQLIFLLGSLAAGRPEERWDRC